MFSSGEAKTVPCASVARHVGGVVRRMRRIGPEMSLLVSADTQDWSERVFSSWCSVAEGSSCWVVRLVDVDCFLDGWEPSVVVVEVDVCLRFLGLSPLKVRGLTIFNGGD